MEENLVFFEEWLNKYLNFERTPKKGIFWLETMKFFCQKLNNPQLSYKSFHVAGSKGKGSMSIMIASILEEKGLNVGVYTSPHILDMRERISTLKGFFPYEVYKNAAEELINCVENTNETELPEQRPLTWFELVTLFAMLCFKYAKVDYVVWEVGLGGRLDATNVIVPECCCIGPIEMEHIEYLGDTLEKIAFEKAGIIKDGIPVFVAGQQSDSVKKVFKDVSEEHNSPLCFVDEKGKIDKIVYKSTLSNNDSLLNPCVESVLFSDYFKRPLNVKLKLLGDFQVENALLVSMAVKKVLPFITEEDIENGLQKASLPARFEIVRIKNSSGHYSSLAILDGAHTKNSIAFTLNTFNKVVKSDAVIVFACAADKDVEKIAELFSENFDFSNGSAIFLTRPGETKTCDFERMQTAFSSCNVPYYMSLDYCDTLSRALKMSFEKKLPLLVIGSFYLVAEFKKLLNGANFDSCC